MVVVHENFCKTKESFESLKLETKSNSSDVYTNMFIHYTNISYLTDATFYKQIPKYLLVNPFDVKESERTIN